MFQNLIKHFVKHKTKVAYYLQFTRRHQRISYGLGLFHRHNISGIGLPRAHLFFYFHMWIGLLALVFIGEIAFCLADNTGSGNILR